MSTGAFNRGASLRFGTLSRIWCPNCRAETVHDRFNRCAVQTCRHKYEPVMHAFKPKFDIGIVGRKRKRARV